MKRYIHKPTRVEYQKQQENTAYPYYSALKTGDAVCVSVVESGGLDWEEIKPEPEVPPGIQNFKNASNNSINWIWQRPAFATTEYYNNWVRESLAKGSIINSIRVNDELWTVGDETNRGVIEKLFYTGGDWHCQIKDNGCWFVSSIYKPPTKKPIVILQGHELYNGDPYYYVDGFYSIHHINVGEDCGGCNPLNMFFSHCFATKEFSEQYIRYNKPVYPAGLVEPLFEWYGENPKNLSVLDLIRKLKSFKEKK